MRKKLKATEHAYKRAKTRFGWKPRVLDKMMRRAYRYGIKHTETHGHLYFYLTTCWYARREYEIRIYGENLFFFSADKKLITLYRIDNKMIKYLKILK